MKSTRAENGTIAEIDKNAPATRQTLIQPSPKCALCLKIIYRGHGNTLECNFEPKKVEF